MLGPYGARRIVLLPLMAAVAIVPVLRASDTEAFRECESRCGPLSGAALHRCLRTCMNAKRGSGAAEGAGPRGTYKECESACSSLGGLEGVRCIRACMEERREPRPVPEKKTKEKPAAVTACESRCAVLPDGPREKCMVRCKKGKHGEYRDPLRSKN